jgi:hypothetical protein
MGKCRCWRPPPREPALRGLDAAGISRAMRIATTLLLTPSHTNAVAGATALNVAGGMSGRRC